MVMNTGSMKKECVNSKTSK
ncbi:hypothetical protein pipiens_009494, partial [Culex pipiens pipiens]